jgi:hypothetical protein
MNKSVLLSETNKIYGIQRYVKKELVREGTGVQRRSE